MLTAIAIFPTLLPRLGRDLTKGLVVDLGLNALGLPSIQIDQILARALDCGHAISVL
ncbi:hypothetical protein [Rhodovulum sp. FJ3]|jgi:hypothetical protein|uniref:hypothetical protein n=1 Tax=Rhodovulum sp. FJ3 TaxID=3079053 RepID=UPI00293DF962|nr:hypothetical protein [Rhodovulum sp. FJ3]MDV4169764.1 hypothetical protein [Rhodovulum sp. FJ3]MEC8630434.1 hypothetical protein [Pseudomonadota bacterium]